LRYYGVTYSMAKIKTSIALDEDLLKWVDIQIEKRRFANRTHAVEYALQQLIDGEKIAGTELSYTIEPQLGYMVAENHGGAPSKKKQMKKG